MSKIEQTIAAKLQRLRCPVHGTHPCITIKNGDGQFEIRNACCPQLAKVVEDNMPRVMSEVIQEQISQGLKSQ